MAKKAEVEKDTDGIIVIGDKIDIVVETGQVYRAMIEDRVEDGPFLVAIPSRKGIPMFVHQDDDIYLVFYRESGRYIAHMKVIALEKRGEIRYMWLLQKTVAQKNQRREAYRLPVSFSVQIYEIDLKKEERLVTGNPAEEWEKYVHGDNPDEEARAVALEQANSKDLSITGIALITQKQYNIDEKYILVMQIESSPESFLAKNTAPPQTIELNASVRRSIPWRVSGKFDTGMQFFGMSKQVSEEIARFVLTEQQRQIRLGKLRHT